MRELAVKNWSKFQHYKHRRPPWIKLHRELLDDCDFQCLPLASKALAPMLWLLASENTDGNIRMESKNLAFRLRMTESDLTGALIPLIEAGFFEDASGVRAERVQGATPEYRVQSTEKNILSEENGSSDAKNTAPLKETPKPASNEGTRLSALLKREILRNDPKAESTITQAHERKWAKVADRMMTRDKLTEGEIADMIDWVQHNDFWTPNILSMSKLREKFPQLRLQRKRDDSPHNNGNGNGYQPRPPRSRPLSEIQKEQVREGLSDAN